MMRWLALLWAVVVLLAGGYLVSRTHAGLPLRTDLLALLPREERDPVLQRANETVTRNLSRRIIILVGHRERAAARAAAARLRVNLAATGLIEPDADALSAERLKRVGQLYFPYRRQLLAEADRALLIEGRGEHLAQRALAQVFGVGGIADARMLLADPFLLLPAFLASLPAPLSRLAPDEGMLSLVEREITWVAVLGVLSRDPFAIDVQERLAGAYARSAAALKAERPDLELKRLGAVFFAHAGTQRGLAEASLLSTISIAGSVILIVLAFRRLAPLIGNLVAVGVGIGMGLAACLALFGDLHLAALLFGTSLIGMAVDYGLFYTASVYDPATRTPTERLRATLPGMTLGLITTIIGYGALLLAPFPGLHQIAVFSVIGLVAAYLTVVLWLPLADRSRPERMGPWLQQSALGIGRFWEASCWRYVRLAMLAVAALIALAGLARFHTNDDVRRLQALEPALVREQEEIRALIGATASSQYVLVEAVDDETALARTERLLPVLARLVKDGAMSGVQAPAAFVPSAARQRESLALVTALERAQLAPMRDRLGLPAPVAAAADAGVLVLPSALAGDAIPFLRELVLEPGLHVAALQGLARPDHVRAAVTGLPGVRFVDPTAEFSALLGQYRTRAMLLTAFSALLMYLGLALRYGTAGAGWVMLPAVATAVLVPACLSLAGQTYTFFHAMAQVLLLAIGTDYAIFCAEGRGSTNPATLLAVALAAATTLLSFGLLAASSVPAVSNFGSAMLIGISLSMVLAPLASRARRGQNSIHDDQGARV